MPQKILLVDDEPRNLDLLEQELTDLGYGVEPRAVELHWRSWPRLLRTLFCSTIRCPA